MRAPERVLEELHREVRIRAAAGGRIVELVGVRLREGEELADTPDGNRRVDHQDQRDRTDQRDRCEVAHDVEGQLRKEEGIDHQRHRDGHDGVAVRGRAHDELRADVAGSTAAIVDEHLLAERLGHLLRQRARQVVDAASRHQRDHHAHGLRRVALGRRLCTRPCEPDRETGNERCATSGMQERSHAGSQGALAAGLHRRSHGRCHDGSYTPARSMLTLGSGRS